MNMASFKLLTAAILLALGASACVDHDDDQATAQTAVTTPPAPTSSTADGSTAQSTTEGATASSFESTPGTGAATADATDTTVAVVPRPSFESLDLDRDGFIARTEVPAGHALLGSWAEYDADNDARIARSDFDRYLIAVHPQFADLDKDADGSLTRAELPSSHTLYTGFAAYDSNADTRLSRAEFDAYGSGGAAPLASATDTGVDEIDTDETD